MFFVIFLPRRGKPPIQTQNSYSDERVFAEWPIGRQLGRNAVLDNFG